MKYYLNKAINKLKEYNYKSLNLTFLFSIVALTTIGLNVISSASNDETFIKKQILGLILGTIMLVVLALVDYKFVLRFYVLIYAFNVILLLAVKFFGPVYNGARRWLEFQIFQLQPSEFAKIFIILFLAKIITKNQENFNTPKNLVKIIILFAIPLYLVLDQPDLSTSIVICVVFASIMFMGGLSVKIIYSLLGLTIPATVIFVYLILQPNQQIIEPYQFNRLVGFYDESNEKAAAINYQQENSVMAIGSGGLWGKGLHNDSEDSVKNGNYISEPETDFIFTIVGEELGFVGTMSVLILMLTLILSSYYTGYKAMDLSGKLICYGFGTLIAIQSFVNMGVATKILPNTGLPLPFVSYGLSSLLSLFIGAGIVLNVSLQKKTSNYIERSII